MTVAFIFYLPQCFQNKYLSQKFKQIDLVAGMTFHYIVDMTVLFILLSSQCFVHSGYLVRNVGSKYSREVGGGPEEIQGWAAGVQQLHLLSLVLRGASAILDQGAGNLLSIGLQNTHTY